ncbi:F-box protein SKIP23-like isoform X2 [Spinacia oleracea]|uniref:F-box protein SKIP23-like isoform X2 n=1 Tax=Spinacia oleracea TaxID=3562 RepID=A0A9R0KDD5_SPIOL|nr:F-box protein SKIP23-like isoform X2 [Spinacia oleracea]
MGERGGRVKRRKQTVVDWSALPPELLSEIGKRLQFRLDLLRFRSVCKPWRNSLSSKSKEKVKAFTIPEPPLLYPFVYSKKRERQISFILTERTVYTLHPNESQIHCRNKCGSYGLGNWCSPLIAEFEEILPKRFVPHQLAARCSFRNFSKVKNMLDFKVCPISKFYGIVAANHKQGFQFSNGYLDVDKVVVVADYNYVSINYPMSSDDDENNNVIVGALLAGGKVGLLRLLGSELDPDPIGWRVINYGEDDKDFRFDDIVNLGGKLCVIDSKGRAFTVDICSLELTQIAVPPPPICNMDGEGILLLQRRKRLVEDSGSLYLLVPFGYEKCWVLESRIKVYKLRVQTRDWVEVVSLGDLSLFVGYDFSFAASASNVFTKAEGNRNCIFFARTSFPHYNKCITVDFKEDLLFEGLPFNLQVGVFDLPDGTNFRLASGQRRPEITYNLPCCLVHSELVYDLYFTNLSNLEGVKIAARHVL